MKRQLKSALSVVMAMAMGLSSISVPALAEESDLQAETTIELETTADTETVTQEEEEVAEDTTEASEKAEADDDTDDKAVASDEKTTEDADTTEEKSEEEDEEEGDKSSSSSHSMNADIVLSDYSSSEDVKSVNIQAYADSEEDTYGYIFFWQYDGTFPDEASAWADYFNTPYFGITAEEIDEDFSEIYLPVTLADGSAGGASTEMIQADNYACVAFDMPAGSSMDTTLSLSLTDEIKDDLHVMLEATYVDTYKDDLITTDYLPLDWEGDEADEADEGEEIPFDEDDEFEIEDEELESEEESEDDNAKIIETGLVKLNLGVGGYLDVGYSEDSIETYYYDENNGDELEFNAGEDIYFAVTAYPFYYTDSVFITDIDGNVLETLVEDYNDECYYFTLQADPEMELVVNATFIEDTEEIEYMGVTLTETTIEYQIGENGYLSVEQDDSGVTYTNESMDESGILDVLYPSDTVLSMTAMADEGYVLDEISAIDENGNELLTYSGEEASNKGMEFDVETTTDSISISVSFKEGEDPIESVEELTFDDLEDGTIAFATEGYGYYSLHTKYSETSMLSSDYILDKDEDNNLIVDLNALKEDGIDELYIYALASGEGVYSGAYSTGNAVIEELDYDNNIGGYAWIKVDLTDVEEPEAIVVRFPEEQYGISTLKAADFTKSLDVRRYYRASSMPGPYSCGKRQDMYNKRPLTGELSRHTYYDYNWGGSYWYVKRSTFGSVSDIYSNFGVSTNGVDGEEWTKVGLVSSSGTDVMLRCTGCISSYSEYSGLGDMYDLYMACCDIDEDDDWCTYTFVIWGNGGNGSTQTKEGYIQFRYPSSSEGTAKVRFRKYLHTEAYPVWDVDEAPEAGNSTFDIANANAKLGQDVLGIDLPDLTGDNDNDDDNVEDTGDDADLRKAVRFKVYRLTDAGKEYIQEMGTSQCAKATVSGRRAINQADMSDHTTYNDYFEYVYQVIQDVYWATGSGGGYFKKVFDDYADDGYGRTGYYGWTVDDQDCNDVYVVLETDTPVAMTKGWQVDKEAGIPDGMGEIGAIFMAEGVIETMDKLSIYYKRWYDYDGLKDWQEGTGGSNGTVKLYDNPVIDKIQIKKIIEDGYAPADVGLKWSDFSWQLSTTDDFDKDYTIEVPFSTGDPTSSSITMTIYGLAPGRVYYIRESPNCKAVKDGYVELNNLTISFYVEGDSKAWYSDTTWTYDDVTAMYHPIIGLSYELDVNQIVNELQFGYLKLKKQSDNTTITNNNSAYSLANAQYTVYEDSGCSTPATDMLTGETAVFTTDADGNSNTVALKFGNYYVKETKQPNGYKEDTTVYPATVSADNLTEETAEYVNMPSGHVTDEPLAYYFDILLDKSTPYNTDKSLAGAVFKAEYYAGATSASGDATRTWYFETKQDSDGNYVIKLAEGYLASDYPNADLYYDSNGTPCIPLGTLVLTEEKAPTGFVASTDKLTYVLESDTYSVTNGSTTKSGNASELSNRTISEEIVNSASIVEIPPFGGVIAYKIDDETAKGEPQGDAKLDATFSIYNKNSYTVARKSDPDTAYATDEKVMEITADSETGVAESGVELQGASSYHLEETKAPTGYTSSGSNLSFDFTLPDEDGYIYDASKDSEKISNVVQKGGITLQKYNLELKDADNYGIASLADAEFTIINASDHSALNKDGKSIPTAKSQLSSNPTYSELRALADSGTYTMQKITTDSKGSATTGAKALPYGTYYVIETKSSSNYWIDTSFVGKVVIREDGVMLNLGETNGSSSFLDIYETDSSLDSSVDQQPRRNELRFAKVDIDGEPFAYIPFLIEAYDADGNLLEQHVIVSNADGICDTSKRSKTDSNVNGMDKYVENDTITAEGEKHLQEASEWGIWFGTTSAENNSYGSLYDSYYRIQELKCEANADKHDNLLHSETFLVTNDSGELTDLMSDNALMYDYHTFVNTVIELESYAEDIQSGSKTVSAYSRTQVSDEVTYTHVSAGDSYRMETQFIDITTNKIVPIVGTNDSDEVVTDNWVTKVFVPEKTTGTTNTHGSITMTAILDTTGLEGHTIVAIDYLYENVEGNWLCVSSHADYEDEDQMLYVPDIHTSAVDGLTGDREGAEATDTYIVDTVDFMGLGKGIQYVLTMEVVDADTGKSINGNVVQSKVLYSRTNENYTGTVVMPEYALDASDLAGRTVVVVERLYLADEDGNPEGEPVVEHDTLLDEDQTIHYTEVETTAKDGETDDHVGTVEPIATVYDEVKLTNLVFDDNDHEDSTQYTYTVTGGLVYQTDFTDAEGVSHKAGDPVPTLDGTYDSVTITCDSNGNATFTYADGTKAEGTIDNIRYGYNRGKTVDPSDEGNNEYVTDKTAMYADVTVELIYKVDSTLLEGTTVVVFEDVLHNDVTIATHHDLDDDKQSVHYPKLETSAQDVATESNVGYITEDGTIVDTVILTNLVPGMTYTITGRLMDQATGEDLVIDGKTFEASADIFVTNEGEITSLTGEAVTTTNYNEELCQVDGTVDLTFNLDASGLEAMTAVAFEKLYHNSVEVTNHEDLTDHDESVYFPMIRSNAWDSETMDHVGTVEGVDVVYDTVYLWNLKIGEEYTVYGVLYDRDSGEPILDPEGNLMTETCTFIAGETTALSVLEHGSADGHVEDITDDSLEIRITELNEEYGYVNCEFDLAIPVDTRDLEGVTAVIVETLNYNGLDIANDYEYAWDTEYESLHYVSLSSDAYDTTTNEKLGAVPAEGGSTSIHDDITATNLIEGMEYTLNGVLMVLSESDIENGDIKYLKEDGTLTDDKSEAYTQSITFTAESDTADLELEFVLTTDKIQGMAFVVETDMYHNDVLVDAHPEEYTDGWHEEDLAEEAVYYPAIKTNATDTITEEHISDARGMRTIEDRVWFENLFLGEEYTIEGQLVYQGDFVDADGVQHYEGEPVSEARSVTFTAEPDITEAMQDDGKTAVIDSVTLDTYETGQQVISGYVTLTFEVDESALAGATLVAFEDLYPSDMSVDLCPHHNLRDLPQTIRIPKIGTNATSEGIDENSIYDENGNFKDIVINDRISYENLWTQEELDLMHEQGLDLIYIDGTYRISDRTIFDINESATYTLKGVIIDKETGEPLVNVNGDTYVVYSDPFTPEDNNGYYDMEFVLNGADFVVNGECILEGKSIVVFEYLYVADNPDDCTDDRETAFHEDIEDTDQDIRFPKGRTHATDTDDAVDITGPDYVDTLIQAHEGESTTSAHEINPDGTVSITDMFAFENLHGATEYTVTAELEKVTGYDEDGVPNAWEPAVDDDGNPIVQTVILDTSIYSEDYEDSVSGVLPIVFEFPAESLAGSVTVVFESVFRGDGTPVLVHADITDEAQTVAFPKIGTQASDAITGTSTMLGAEKSYILDKVSYEALAEGEEYTLTASMYDQESGLKVEDAETTGTFIAGAENQVITPSGTYTMTVDEVVEYLGGDTTTTEWGVDAKAESYATAEAGATTPEAGAEADDPDVRISGEVYILVELDSSWLTGHTLVAFETLYNDGKEIAEHKDIDDEDQSVDIPKIGTTATVENGKEVDAKNGVEILDTVAYENLIPGQEYEVRGVLMDKNTGESLGIYSSAEFTPEEESGTVEVSFNVDVSSLGGHVLVVFEELVTNKDNDEDSDDDTAVIVAEHKDINDEAQSITVRQPSTDTPTAVKTGDDFNGTPIVIALLVIVILILIGILLRKRQGPGTGGSTPNGSGTPMPNKPDAPVDGEMMQNEADVPVKDEAENPAKGEAMSNKPEAPVNGEAMPDKPEAPVNGEKMPDKPEAPVKGEKMPNKPGAPMKNEPEAGMPNKASEGDLSDVSPKVDKHTNKGRKAENGASEGHIENNADTAD